VLELASQGGQPWPNVRDAGVSIDGSRIRLSLEGPVVDATGGVKSVLQAEDSADPGAGRAADKKTPSMFKAGQPVTVTADALRYDGASGKATYTGSVQMWQAETTIKATKVVVDERTGDLSAEGDPVATTTVLQQTGANGTKERSVANAKSRTFNYEEALRRATYSGEAFVTGPAGELRAAKIELYLRPAGDELDRAEAYESVTLSEQRRKTTGDRMTYLSEEERYVITGTPVRIVDECNRETLGRTLTLFRATDRVLVDGNEQMRTRTQGSAACP
jgi:lipopolysaccharide transport protein LptA